MAKQQAKQRIEKLRKLINHHRYLYHVLGRQEISEAALDSLKKELFDLEEKYPELIIPGSPTQRVEGKAQEQFEKARHTEPMLSFNDAFSEQDMLDWESRLKRLLPVAEAKQLDYFTEPKIDGLAVSLIYKRGLLVRGATRGDGRVGEDVTANLKTIESIPLWLERDVSCEVRGEVFMTKKNFEALNKARVKKGEAPYANPRNTAAGSIRQLDPKIAAERKLSFLAWQLLNRETQEEEYNELKALGFRPVEGKYFKDLQGVFRHYQVLQAKRDKLPYHIDGIVVSVNNNKLFQKLGVVGKAPRGSMAFKFPLVESQTIVEDIKVQIGRTGAVTPVAVLKPVKVGGVTITRATLHNEDEINRLGLEIGDTVIVGRAGDVIPQVVKVLKELRTGREKPFRMPKKCPDCGAFLSKRPGEVVWRCPNANCQVRKQRQLYHFVGKGAFDIEGLGPKIVNQFLKEGLLSDAADIFELKQGDLIPLERFAEKSAENLVAAVEKSKRITLSRFIFALGIRGVGEETAVLLSVILREAAGRPKDLLKAFQQLSFDDLQSIKDIGPVVGKSIYDWFHEKRNLEFLARLLKYVQIENPKLSIINNQLKGKTFVLTGELETLTRGQAKEKIRALGGDVSSSVSKNTGFVVVGKDPGSKYDRAQKLNIKTLTEQEFLKMLTNV